MSSKHRWLTATVCTVPPRTHQSAAVAGLPSQATHHDDEDLATKSKSELRRTRLEEQLLLILKTRPADDGQRSELKQKVEAYVLGSLHRPRLEEPRVILEVPGGRAPVHPAAWRWRPAAESHLTVSGTSEHGFRLIHGT